MSLFLYTLILGVIGRIRHHQKRSLIPWLIFGFIIPACIFTLFTTRVSSEILTTAAYHSLLIVNFFFETIGNLCSPLIGTGPIKRIEIHDLTIVTMSLPGLLFMAPIGTVIYFTLQRTHLAKIAARQYFFWLGTLNFFLSQIETPFFSIAWLRRLSRGEVFGMISMGYASCACGTLLLYGEWFEETLPEAASHIFAANIISILLSAFIADTLIPRSKDIPFVANETRPNMRTLLLTSWKVVPATLCMMFCVAIYVALFRSSSGFLDGLFSFPDSVATQSCIESDPNIWRRYLNQVGALFARICGVPPHEIPLFACSLSKGFLETEYIALADVLTQSLSKQSTIKLLYALTSFTHIYSVAFQGGALWVLLPQFRKELPQLLMGGLLVAILSRFLLLMAVSSFL